MYLHNGKELFEEVITEANAQTGIAQSIIEKDYYVTMILKLLTKSNPDIVFKGGTSLSKCFHLIDRFSEDIDITFSEHIGESRRKNLNTIFLNRSVMNWRCQLRTGTALKAIRITTIISLGIILFPIILLKGSCLE